MKSRFVLSVCSSTSAVLSLAIAGGRPVYAHIPDQYDSVHFHSGHPDFGTAPRDGMVIGDQDVRPADNGMNSFYFQEPERKLELSAAGEEHREAERQDREEKARKQAARALEQNHWVQAAAIYARIETLPHRRGDLSSRIAILKDAARRPQPLPPTVRTALEQYMRGMDTNLPLLQKVADREDSGFVRPYAQYQVLSAYAPNAPPYNPGLASLAIVRNGYGRLLKESLPDSLRESTLIMLARVSLLTDSDEDSDIPTGSNALRTLLKDYPRTRFRRSARGLLARIDYQKGHFGPAIETYLAIDDLPSVEIVLKSLPSKKREPYIPRLLAGYLRHLDNADNDSGYSQAITDIRRIMGELSLDGASQFVRMLRRDPTLAAPYFYYRLYHCENTPKDLRSLARLADRILATHPETLFPANVQERLAEVFYQDRRYDEALSWSRRAENGPPSLSDRALYVHGASLQKQKRNREALADFDRLLARSQNVGLRFAAHEERAILQEALGDLGGALDEYFTLDYKPDIAFFLDARLTKSQLASYIAARPHHPQHSLLLYSLGMRAMRDEDWDSASRCFHSLPRPILNAFRHPPKEKENEYSYTWDDDSPHPMTALSELSRLKRLADQAASHRDKAAALYAYGSYYYKNGTLLLYNGALWQGERELSFDFWWNARHATSEDEAAARQHMYAHEVYARAKTICMEVAENYPETPSAPPALYRAACCEAKLANFNGWWREDCRRHDHVQAAANLMARFAHRYPRHHLAAEARKFARVWSEQALEDARERHNEDKEYGKGGNSWDTWHGKDKDAF